MSDYLLVSTVLSISVVIALPLLRSAPPRLNLWICLIGLFAWSIPWQQVALAFQQAPIVLIQYVASATFASKAIHSVPALPVTVNWLWAFWSLNAVGLAVFIVRCVKQGRQLATYQNSAQPIHRLWQQHGFKSEAIPIFVVNGFTNAFVSGYFKQRVWLGSDMVRSEAIESILQHELMHIRGHDNFILLFIALFRDIFWWNPLVHLLAQRAKQYVELSCDQRCHAVNPKYQGQLAHEMLKNYDAPMRSELVTPFFWKRKFNIYRLSQLDKEFLMRKVHFIPIVAIALAGLVACAIPAVSSQEDEAIMNHLTIKTVVGKNTNEAKVSFIGEPEAEKLISLARSTSALVEVEMEGDHKRVISIKSQSQDETAKFLHAFDGTAMEGLFAPKRSDPALSGTPILIDLQVEVDKEPVFSATLATNNTHWTGITSGDYLIRIMPTLVPDRMEPAGDPAIRIDAEISEKRDGAYEVVARPRFITRLGEQGVMTISDDKHDFRLELVATKAN